MPATTPQQTRHGPRTCTRAALGAHITTTLALHTVNYAKLEVLEDARTAAAAQQALLQVRTPVARSGPRQRVPAPHTTPQRPKAKALQLPRSRVRMRPPLQAKHDALQGHVQHCAVLRAAILDAEAAADEAGRLQVRATTIRIRTKIICIDLT